MIELKDLFILLCFLIFGALLYILGRISANKETKFGIKERFIKKIKNDEDLEGYLLRIVRKCHALNWGHTEEDFVKMLIQCGITVKTKEQMEKERNEHSIYKD